MNKQKKLPLTETERALLAACRDYAAHYEDAEQAERERLFLPVLTLIEVIQAVGWGYTNEAELLGKLVRKGRPK